MKSGIDPRVREEICVALEIFAGLGFEWGTAGHLTVRDPLDPECFWVNPVGVPFGATEPDDIVLVSSDGAVLEGRHPVAGFSAQHRIHTAKPGNDAVVHVHSPFGFAWSSEPTLLDPIDDDSAGIHGLQAISRDLDDDPGASLGASGRILIRKGHGFVTVGRSIAEAAWYLMAAERAAQGQLTLAAARRPSSLVEEPWLSRWKLTPDFAEQEYAQHAASVRARRNAVRGSSTREGSLR